MKEVFLDIGTIRVRFTARPRVYYEIATSFDRELVKRSSVVKTRREVTEQMASHLVLDLHSSPIPHAVCQ